MTSSWPASAKPPLGRVASFRVSAEGETPAGSTPTAAKAAAPKTVSVGGPGPELINGRMAMIALPVAALLEVNSSKPTFELMANSQGQFALVVAFFSAASLIPILKGVESEPLGPPRPVTFHVELDTLSHFPGLLHYSTMVP